MPTFTFTHFVVRVSVIPFLLSYLFIFCSSPQHLFLVGHTICSSSHTCFCLTSSFPCTSISVSFTHVNLILACLSIPYLHALSSLSAPVFSTPFSVPPLFYLFLLFPTHPLLHRRFFSICQSSSFPVCSLITPLHHLHTCFSYTSPYLYFYLLLLFPVHHPLHSCLSLVSVYSLLTAVHLLHTCFSCTSPFPNFYLFLLFLVHLLLQSYLFSNCQSFPFT